jgi:hypothetical protein
VAGLLTDLGLIGGDALTLGLEEAPVAAVANEGLVAVAELRAQVGEDGVTVRGVLARMRLVPTHDVAVLLDPHLLDLERGGVVALRTPGLQQAVASGAG